jgi:hypothetical protein
MLRCGGTGCGKTARRLGFERARLSSRAVSRLEVMAARLEAAPFQNQDADLPVFRSL